MPISKVCEFCKKAFLVPPRRHETVRYCSRECKAEAGYLQLPCATCGTQFQRKASDQSRSASAFCSRDCYLASLPGRKLKVSPDAPRYYKVCEHCNVDFRVTATRKDTAQWCSKECMAASPAWRQMQSEKQQAEKGWRWSGGKYRQKSGYVRVKRNINGVAYVDFDHRLVVLEAMLGECPDHPFITLVKGKKRLDPRIEVHHIDRDRSNNALDNLLAVSKDAHAQIHHRNKKPDPWECWPSHPTKW